MRLGPHHTFGMQVVRCALGVIQDRGQSTVDPSVVPVGADEAQYLARHVRKVRETVAAGGRSLFVDGSNVPTQLGSLVGASSDAHFMGVSKSLQDSLARQMKSSTNAKDCVTAIVLTSEPPDPALAVTILKLDAVLEAARMHRLEHGITFEVLKELLPEPGKLQKALSWPDPRGVSDVIMLDTNFSAAQYFENAFGVEVSPKSTDAEENLVRIIAARIPAARVDAVINAAADLEGPLDEVLETLAADYPELEEAASFEAAESRPSGIVRRNKVAARKVIWKGAGFELRISPELAAKVSKSLTPAGTWMLTIETADEPFPAGAVDA
ncbi:MAG: hypothetical protein JWN67_2328 [Actinomycetia bacterium]|nr:hypothetical protein [Actinomycetes bacterium]